MCNCRRKRAAAQVKSILKKTGTKLSTPTSRSNGVVNGRRVITRTIK